MDVFVRVQGSWQFNVLKLGCACLQAGRASTPQGKQHCYELPATFSTLVSTKNMPPLSAAVTGCVLRRVKLHKQVAQAARTLPATLQLS